MADTYLSREPLIIKDRNFGLDGKIKDLEENCCSFGSQTEIDATEGSLLDRQPKLKIWDEFQEQLFLAAPMVGVNLLQFSLQVVSVMFVGHLGKLSLAGASIATSVAGVSGYSVLKGMGSALETLCGQAYGGKQFRLLGTFLQRALLILNLASILISVLWFNMEKVLVLLHQDANIAAKAGEYIRWLIPGLFAYGSLQCTVKFLQTQAVVWPMLVCSVLTLLFHVPLCYILVFKLEMGSIGAALAASSSNWFNLALLFLCVTFSKICRKTWTSFSKEAYLDLKGFMKLAIPSALMVCLEWWAYEIVVLFSGTLPNPAVETSTVSICLNTAALLYMIPFGLSAAVSTRVSNELGAGHALAARLAVRVSLILAVFDALFAASLLISTRRILGSAFTNDSEVVRHVAALVPIIACIAVMDAIQGVLSGIARGCGWQAAAAYANLGAYYIIGLPIAFLLAFHFHLNAQGLWLGALCGISTQMISLLIITLRLDWHAQARKSISRVHTTTSSLVS